MLLLLGATFGLLGWERRGMERTVVLDPGSTFLRASAIDDRGEGGSSVCSLETDTGGWWLHYDVRPGANWSFCVLNLAFVNGDSSAARDLSNFDTLVVNMRGMRGPNVRFQTQIKARDRRMESEAGIRSLKYHDMIFVPVGSGPSRTSMPLDNFVIPPWWAGRFNVPARHQGPNLQEVREIEFATSAERIIMGSGVFGIRSIELHGKWIRHEVLLKALFAIWLAYIVGGVGVRLYRSIQDLREIQGQSARFKDLSERDPLTLLHNRRGIENRLADLARQCAGSENDQLGLLIIDLDHFKHVNDSLGHEAGDQILRLLANILQEEMRPNNLAARWGGEEFVLLLPGIPATRLAPAAERIRRRIEADLLHAGMSITASIGAALGPAEEFHSLVHRADQALYRAKANGRNRVELAT